MWVLILFLLTPVYEIQTITDSVSVPYAIQTFIANCDSISYVETLLKGNVQVEGRFIVVSWAKRQRFPFEKDSGAYILIIRNLETGKEIYRKLTKLECIL